WASFPAATPPAGTTTTARRPQRAAYAEADALVLPVEAHNSVCAPASRAFAVATAMPRSLNDPLGLRPSYLKYNCPRPIEGPIRADRTSGVDPSPSVTLGVAAVTGRWAAWPPKTPAVMAA